MDVDLEEAVVRRAVDVDVVLERDRLVGVGVVEDEREVRERGRREDGVAGARGAGAVEQVDRERDAARGERGRVAGDDVHLSRAAADGGDEPAGKAREAAAVERHALGGVEALPEFGAERPLPYLLLAAERVAAGEREHPGAVLLHAARVDEVVGDRHVPVRDVERRLDGRARLERHVREGGRLLGLGPSRAEDEACAVLHRHAPRLVVAGEVARRFRHDRALMDNRRAGVGVRGGIGEAQRTHAALLQRTRRAGQGRNRNRRRRVVREDQGGAVRADLHRRAGIAPDERAAVRQGIVEARPRDGSAIDDQRRRRTRQIEAVRRHLRAAGDGQRAGGAFETRDGEAAPSPQLAARQREDAVAALAHRDAAVRRVDESAGDRERGVWADRLAVRDILAARDLQRGVVVVLVLREMHVAAGHDNVEIVGAPAVEPLVRDVHSLADVGGRLARVGTREVRAVGRQFSDDSLVPHRGVGVVARRAAP